MRRGRHPLAEPTVVTPDDPCWPAGLARPGFESPAHLSVAGQAELLRRPVVGLFCSQRAPGAIVVRALEVAACLACQVVTIASGFQSPVEREVLAILLRRGGRVVICPARGLRGMSLRRGWSEALEDGRMLLVSAAGEEVRRPTASAAVARNRLTAALSSHLLVLHASPGGRLWALAREAAAWRQPLACIDHPANADLRLLGAVAIGPEAGGMAGFLAARAEG